MRKVEGLTGCSDVIMRVEAIEHDHKVAIFLVDVRGLGRINT